jgi:hypothetical protein
LYEYYDDSKEGVGELPLLVKEEREVKVWFTRNRIFGGLYI